MIELKITFNVSTKEVQVQGGVINDKGLCYMMLECARDAIKDYNDKQQQESGRIVAAQQLPVLRRNGS